MARESLNVSDLRAEILNKIHADVERAFNNRVAITYDPVQKEAVELIEISRDDKKLLSNYSNDESLSIEADDITPNEVRVENSHDYEFLIMISLKKLAQLGAIDEDDIEKIAEGVLKHEFEHHVPVLGDNKIDISYGVSFFEDPYECFVGFRPHLRISGEVPVDVYRDAVGAAVELSPTDELKINGLNEWEQTS